MAKAVQCDRCKAFTAVPCFPPTDPKEQWICIQYDSVTDTQTILCPLCHEEFVQFMAGASLVTMAEAK